MHEVIRNGEIVKKDLSVTGSDCQQIVFTNRGEVNATVFVLDSDLYFILKPTEYLMMGDLDPCLQEVSKFKITFVGGEGEMQIMRVFLKPC